MALQVRLEPLFLERQRYPCDIFFRVLTGVQRPSQAMERAYESGLVSSRFFHHLCLPSPHIVRVVLDPFPLPSSLPSINSSVYGPLSGKVQQFDMI